MAYATLDYLRGPDGRLVQFTTTAGTADVAKDIYLQECLDEATAIINEELGFTLTAAANGTQVVYGTGTVWLPLPLFTPGSVSLVTPPAGYSVPDYVESGNALRITNSTGVYTIPPSYALYPPSLYSSGAVWMPGVPYTVTADYGASSDDLVTARMCCLEIAVQLFRFGDAGGSAVVGVEGAGAVSVKNDYSPIVKRMLGYLKSAQGTTGISQASIY
jgi:hypothetical protein